MRGLLGLGLLALTATSAAADGAVATVIPNRPDVPIVINGIDARYAVIEGDWGLARGIHVQPTIYGGRFIDPRPRVGRYFPTEAKAPGYGRLEIEDPTRPPQQAESYFRSYSAQSDPPRASEPIGPPVVIEQSPYGDSNFAPPMRRRY